MAMGPDRSSSSCSSSHTPSSSPFFAWPLLSSSPHSSSKPDAPRLARAPQRETTRPRCAFLKGRGRQLGCRRAIRLRPNQWKGDATRLAQGPMAWSSRASHTSLNLAVFRGLFEFLPNTPAESREICAASFARRSKTGREVVPRAPVHNKLRGPRLARPTHP